MIATTMEPLDIREELKLLDPPSTRDREIFEQVAVRRRSQEVVAAEYSLTQARVSQIVGRVKQWLMTATEDDAGDLPAEMALRLGARMVRLRLENLLSMTMNCFDGSKGKVTIGRVRDTDNGRISEEVTRTSWGDLRYLTHHRQVALSLARLDGVETSPHVERPQRSVEEATAGLRAVQAAQERVDEQQRQLESEQKAQAAAAARPAMESELQAMLALLNSMGEGRDIYRGDLYKNVAPVIPAAAAPANTTAISGATSTACTAHSEHKSEVAAAENGEKRAYNSPVSRPRELTDQQRQRRREFLKVDAA